MSAGAGAACLVDLVFDLIVLVSDLVVFVSDLVDLVSDKASLQHDAATRSVSWTMDDSDKYSPRIVAELGPIKSKS